MPWMPQIVICPESLNEGPMLMSLLKEPNVVANAITDEVIGELNSVVVRSYLEARMLYQEVWFRSELYSLDITAYSLCFEIANNTGPGCHLLRILGSLFLQKRFYTTRNLAIKYIATHIEGSIMNEANFECWAEEEVGIDFDQYLDGSLNNQMLFWLDKYRGILHLYLAIFDIFELDSNHDRVRKKLIEPQSLSSFNRNQIRTVKSAKEFVQFLPWFLEGANEKTKAVSIEIITNLWKHAMAIYLEADSPTEATMLYNAYKGDSTDILHEENLCEGATHENIREVCSRNNLSSACLGYCEIHKNVTSKQISKLRELLIASTRELSPLFGMLRACHHPSNNSVHDAPDCWTRIITDKGVCFSTRGGAMDQVVPESSDDNFLQFLFYSNKFDYSKYKDTATNINLVQKHQTATVGKMDVSIYGTTLYSFTSWNFPNTGFEVSSQNIQLSIEQVFDSTDELKAMPVSMRKCMIPEDKQLPILGPYTEADCFLECTWRLAAKACQCVPWFLVEYFPHKGMCEAYGNRCFNNLVETRYNKKLNNLTVATCRPLCLRDCDRIIYAQQMQINTRDANLEGRELLEPYFEKRRSMFPNDIADIANQINIDHRGRRGTLTKIQFKVSDRVTQRVVRTATMTVVDLISNIGGTLGLFCGMSVLSMVEVMYWAARSLLLLQKIKYKEI